MKTLPENDEQHVIAIELPLPHMQIRLVRANNTWFVANRGGFKTTRGISFYNLDCVYEMPRSTGVIVSPSFEHLGDNTLNPLINALNEFGFENEVHYIIGTKPPKEWPSPFIRIESKKYDHLMSWHNGTAQAFISMAKRGSANGISAQWGIFDEIKLMKEADLTDTIFPIFRGNEKYFKDSPLFMSKFFATDKLADPSSINWILDKQKLNESEKIDIIITLQVKLNELKEEYNEAGINKKARLKIDINAIEVRLSKLRKNLSFYVEANASHTVQVLGQRWLDDKKKNLKAYEFKIAILNENPTRPEDGFYPDFDEQVHCHSDMHDYDPALPIIGAPDYQHSVSPLALAQVSILPGRDKASLNYIDAIHTKPPDGLAACIQKFCDTYKNHQRKLFYYVYDQTATGRRTDAVEYYITVSNALKRNGWYVHEVYTGSAPMHYQKYIDTQEWLKNEKHNSLDIRVNAIRCDNLIISITGAPARTNRGKTEKDKKYEDTHKYPSLDQARTTHFSDTFDMINHAVLKLKTITPGISLQSGIYL